MKSNLHKTVMRRVYYSFALSFLSESMLWQGFVLGACIALFGRLTHVAAIVRNLEATRIADAPRFVFNSFTYAFTHGEMLTALITLFMIGLFLSFIVRAIPILRQSRSFAAA